MPNIEILLLGIPGRTSQGYLGQASASLVDETVLIDTGSLARRPLLEKAFENVAPTPSDVEHVLLTHVHFDHCDNIDLFENATVHIYGPELERIMAKEYDWATPRNAASMLADLDVETFDTDETIQGFEVIPAAGHTEDHVAFLLEGDYTYGFTGDAMKNTRELVTMDPMVIYDKEAAINTLSRIREAVDFVIPGHDTPFYVDDTGNPVAAMNVEFAVNLQMAPGSATTARVTSDRSELRDLPEEVRDATAEQAFH